MMTTEPKTSASKDRTCTEVRRQARVRLLRDLVQNGLYRIDTDVLADTLLRRLGPELLRA
jgi:anti-sigma28 factor (negative regulator of flagellin synthesis)